MQASNVQLDLSVRESVQSCNSRTQVRGDEAQSSFAKELNKAMDSASSSGHAEASTCNDGSTNPEEKTEVVDKGFSTDVSDKQLAIADNATSSDTYCKGIQLLDKNGRSLVADRPVLVQDNMQDSLADDGHLVSLVKGNVSALEDDEIPLELKPLDIGLVDSVATTDGEASVLDGKPVATRRDRTRGKDVAVDEDIMAALSSGALQSGLDNAATLAVDEVSMEGGNAINPTKLVTGTALDDKITVMDYRTAAENGVTEASLQDGNFTTSVSYGEGSADITFNLAAGVENDVTTNGTERAGESRFASMLSSQIQEHAADFVKTGSIVLQDGNVGTINLVLHPEELGNVKISLELHDKLVSAQITVASEEAFQAFRESISSLKQAFAESGFQTGGFDLSWSGGNQGGFGAGDNGDFSRQQLFSLAQAAYGDVFVDDVADDLLLEQKMYSDSARIAVNIMA